MADMIGAALRGDAALAAQLDAPLAGLHQALFVEANPIPVKWAAAQLGLCQEGIRLPLTWLSEAHRGRVGAALRDAQAQGVACTGPRVWRDAGRVRSCTDAVRAAGGAVAGLLLLAGLHRRRAACREPQVPASPQQRAA